MSVLRSVVIAIFAGLTFCGSVLAADAVFTSVATVAASDKAHDVLKAPRALAIVRTTGDVLVADTMHHRILRISVAGNVAVLAGSGRPGQTDGRGSDAQFKEPSGVAVDETRGVAYVADTGNHTIRIVTFDGNVSTLAGSGRPEDRDGRARQAGFKQPSGVAVDAAGMIVVADTGNSRIKQITPSGVVTTIAGDVHEGFANGPASAAQFNQPEGIAVDSDGAIYISDTRNHVIRKLSNGTVTTIAGTGHRGFVDGSGTTAEFDEPSGLACDEARNLYVADKKNHSIRRISTGSSSIVTTIAGSGRPGFIDGSLTTALFREPSGVAFAGALWVSDAGNDAVRRIDSAVSIDSVEPHIGPAAGGTTARILGSGFVPGSTDVTFGSAAATGVVYVSSHELTVTVPAVSGVVDVTVTTPGGSATLASAYSGVPPPAISTVTPNKGKSFGGDTVTITGANFTSDTTVLFGTAPATTIAVVSGNALTVVTPPGVAGAIDITVTTIGGSATRPAAFTYFAPPVITQFSPASGPAGTTVTITGGNFDTAPGATTALLGTTPLPIASITPVQLVVTIPASGITGRMTVASTGGTTESASSFTVTVPGGGGGTLPPDPTLIATPVDIHSIADFNSTIRFLYTGSNPIQTGITTGAITDVFAAVIRGRALAADGTPLPGAKVTVHAHPEYGSTLTRADGRYDLVVNGGTTFTIDFVKTGYITAQRDAHVDRSDFAGTGDVVLIGYDSASTAIAAGSDVAQIARGSRVEDTDGARQATLMFPAGTTATMTLPNGTTQSLQTLTIRATEYTVGPLGPQRMPAPLPPQTGYTYAAEFSVDEAVAAGANEVQFSKPVAVYIDNFLRFPTGTIVPAGYWDRGIAAWVPSDNGRVIAVLGVAGGIATLDADGDGAADDALGIDEAERRQIASIYTAGASIWRVPITHFSPWDLNWSALPPDGAIIPGADGSSPSTESLKDDACKVSGSIIECENQIVGEAIPIVGTPFALHYESDRVEGRNTHYAIHIPLTPHAVPSSMTSVELKVTVAGRTFTKSYSPASDLVDQIAWDGVDAYGRSLQGSRAVNVEISYVYPALYNPPSGALRAWAQVIGSSASLVRVPARNGVAITRSWSFPLGTWRNPKDDLGGWTISPQHTYDWASKTILGGNGDRRTGATSAGNGLVLSQSFSFFSPNAVAYGPDGSLYLADNVAIRRVNPSATSATTVISLPGAVISMAVDRDGSIYYSQSHRIFKVAPDGTRTVVAGNGATGNAIDGAAGADSPLNVGSLAFDVDGALYFLDIARIVRLGRDGILRVVYQAPQSPDALVSPRDMTVDRDGNLVITDAALRIRKFDIKTGVLTTIAGTGCISQLDFLCNARYDGDGGPAQSAHLAGPQTITAAPDGSIFFWDAGLVTIGGSNFFSVSVLRRIGPDNTITTEAVLKTDPGFFGSLTPSPNALSITANDLAFGPDGLLHVANASSTSIAHFGSVMPGFSATDTLVPNADGTRLFDFNSVGRLVKTIDTYTKATDYSFAYDASGRLLRITDVNGRVTTIERSVTGVPSAIVSPDGARTTLAIGGNGYLASVQNPAGETANMTYFAGGLLKTFRDPRGHTSTMTYDGSGRLLQDLSSSGSFTSASRSGDDRRFQVLRGTAGGRTWTYDIDHGTDNLVTQTTTAPDGTRSVQITDLPDLSTTLTTAEGTVIKQRLTKEPRFGRQSPMLDSADVTTPSGLHLSLKHTRFVNKSSVDPLSMTSSTDTTTVNGRSWTTKWDAATRVFAYTSPKGRTASVTVDSRGMPLSSRESTFTPVTFTYGTAGRLSRVQQGARALSATYDTRGRIASVTDVLNRTFTYTYDDADRLLTQQTPDGRVVIFTYDAGGNVTSIAPPSRPAHAFHYTDDALVDTYTPPSVPNSGVTTYAWTLDHQLHLLTRPDGSTISFGYDGAGRATTIDAAGDTVTYGYTPATGTLASISNRSGSSIAFTWDGDLLTGVTSALGSLHFSYDSSFRLVRETLAGTAAINYGYDDDDLLISVGALSLERDAQTGLVSTSTTGIVSDTYSYDSFGQQSGHTVSVNGTPVITTTLTRDNGGRVTQENDNFYGQQHAKVYSYDTPGRLADVTIDSVATAHYEYDSNGNRTLARSPAGDLTATHDAQDRLLTYGESAYTYTPNGDLAAKTDATGTSRYAYDAFGNLLSVTLPSKTITYEHDAANRRTGKLVDGVVIRRWIYSDDLKIAGELDATGALVSRFVYATRVNVPDYMIRGLTTWRLVTDERGSVRAVINTTTGAVDQYLRYDEFGVVLEDSNPGFQPFGFAGGLYDPDSNLVRFGARDYDARTARWTAKDPIGFDGGTSNLYAYSNGDPINAFDPSGTSGVVVIHSRDEVEDETGGSLSADGDASNGHSYIEYFPDSGGHMTFGTFGNNPDGKGFGLLTNVELDRNETKLVADYTRSAWIDDLHEKFLRRVIKRYVDEGWSLTDPCSSFAHDAWQAATGEDLHYKYRGQSNPVSLKVGIKKANRGRRTGSLHSVGVTGGW